MAEKLTIEITIGEFKILLDGNSQEVIALFDNLQKNGIGKLGKVYNTYPGTTITERTVPGESNNIQSNEIPSLNDIIFKDIPNYEYEWILVFSFFCSEHGKKKFSREELIKKYDESGRKTKSRINHLSNNIKKNVEKGWLKSLDEKVFIITEDGLSFVIKMILEKNNGVKSMPKPEFETKKGETKKTEPKKLSKESFETVSLEIDDNKRNKLRDFYNEKKPKSQADKVLTLIYWLSKENNINEINSNIAFTLLRTVDEPIPKRLTQVLRNLKADSFLTSIKSKKGFFKIHHVGEDYINYKLPKSTK